MGGAPAILAVQPQLAYLRVIPRDVLPRDGFFCEEQTQIGFASWYGFPVHRPRTYVSSGLSGHARRGVPDRARGEGGEPGQAGGRGVRRRRLPVRGVETATAAQHTASAR